MTNFRKRLLLAGVVTLVLLLGGMGLLFWMQPWRPDWQTVQVRTQEHLEQAGFERPRITSDDFRWRYNVRAAKGPKQFVAHVQLGLLWPRVSWVTITTPEDGASRLSVSVYYDDSSVFLVSHRFHENGEAAIVSLGEPQQAVSRSEADELASLVMCAWREGPAGNHRAPHQEAGYTDSHFLRRFRGTARTFKAAGLWTSCSRRSSMNTEQIPTADRQRE